MASTAVSPPGTTPWLAAERLGRPCVQRAHDGVGERREGLARPAAPTRCRTECARRSETSAPGRTGARDRGNPRRNPPARASARGSRASFSGSRQRAEERRVDQRVQHLRDAGRACRRAAARCRARARRARPGRGSAAAARTAARRRADCRGSGRRRRARRRDFPPCAICSIRSGTSSAKWARAAAPLRPRGAPASQRRTVAETSSGWRNPISPSLASVSLASASGGNTRPRRSAAARGACSNRRA